MDELLKIIDFCLDEFIGGEVFFDKLDEKIRENENLIKDLYFSIKEKYPGHKIVASGKFGMYLNNYGLNVDLLVPGSLRKDEEVFNLCPFVKNGDKFIYLDDSFYSGKTFNKINNSIVELGGEIPYIYVFYDGSININDKVISLYRYHKEVL